MSLVKLMAVGDISLQTANDGYPFEDMRQIFESKDVLFGNLETVLTREGQRAEKAILLHSLPEKVSYLKDAGFDILNIANNHIMDLGMEGFHNTLKALRNEELNFIGVNDSPERNYAISEEQGIRLGFLGYTEGGFNLPEKGVWINKIELMDIVRDIDSIKGQCDVIIVSLHWGTENVFYPSPKQIELAHELIDAGTTVILGHHPHVIQGIERYKHGLIAYSLGNFQFKSAKINNSILLCLEFSNKGLEDYHIIPIAMNQNFTPAVANETRGEILNFVDNISEAISNGTLTWKWWFEKIAQEYLSGNMRSFIIRIKKYGLRHFLQCLRWLISPFCLRCYVAIIRGRLKELLGKA